MLLFLGNLSIMFAGTKFEKILSVAATSEIELPSDQAAEKIRNIIQDKKRLYDFGISIPSINLSFFGGTSYENRDIETLKKNLENVKETYMDDDLYYLMKQNQKK